jgi:hypothetical protein
MLKFEVFGPIVFRNLVFFAGDCLEAYVCILGFAIVGMRGRWHLASQYVTAKASNSP